MSGQENRDERLTTPLQKALFKLLCEHGASRKELRCLASQPFGLLLRRLAPADIAPAA